MAKGFISQWERDLSASGKGIYQLEGKGFISQSERGLSASLKRVYQPVAKGFISQWEGGLSVSGKGVYQPVGACQHLLATKRKSTNGFITVFKCFTYKFAYVHEIKCVALIHLFFFDIIIKVLFT